MDIYIVTYNSEDCVISYAYKSSQEAVEDFRKWVGDILEDMEDDECCTDECERWSMNVDPSFTGDVHACDFPDGYTRQWTFFKRQVK